MAHRVLIVSPVRNEAAHIERVVQAMAAQTVPPDRWIVADDGSQDDTLGRLLALEPHLSFMCVLKVPQSPSRGVDRLAGAFEVRAFNWALRHEDWHNYSHIGKLDGDIELPPDYFERLLAAFSERPELGIAGGSLVERTARDGAWRPVRIPGYHVHGALKLYSQRCFKEIGGLQERLGWDTIDETYARMRGFATATQPELVARHHRPAGSAAGVLRGRARAGQCAYVVRYGLPWVLARSVKVAAACPRGLSGAAFVLGYLRAAARSAPKVEDEDFRRFVRGELRARVRHSLLRGWRRRRAGPRATT